MADSTPSPSLPPSPAAAHHPRRGDRRARLARLVRLADWRNSKIPPLLAFAYLLLAGPPAVAPRPALVALALFLTSAFATAAWGHVLNDLADASQDRRLGKITPAAELPRAAALALALFGLALAVAPWVLLPPDTLARGAFGLELVLLAAYALPPLRLKERGRSSLLVDALYAHALPLAITLGLFGALSGNPLAPVPVALLLGWKLAQGLCGALASQIADRRNDRRSATRTWLAAGGALAARRVLLGLLLPLQLVVFVAALAALSPRWPLLLPAYLLFLLGRLLQIHLVWKKGWSYYRRGYPGYSLLNDFHERWLPLLALAILCAGDPRFLPLAAAHLLLFRSAASDLFRTVLPKPSEATR